MTDLKGKKVLVFGDSIMYGSGNGGFGVGEYLERDLGMVCKKYAVGGARVGFRAGKSWVPEQIMKALDEGAEADYIIFDGFTNDCNISEGAAGPDVPLGAVTSDSSRRPYECPTVYELKREGSTFAECFQSVIYTLLLRFPKAKILFIRPHNMGRRDDDLQRQYGELIFSSESDKSAYVLREVNSAVSRNKTIIPLRIENFLPSEAMEFYLGPTHWLDAFPQVLETHLDSIFSILAGLSAQTGETSVSSLRFVGMQVVDIGDLLEAGWTKKQITLREIELDYLCISPDKYNMNDITEGGLEDWVDSVQESAETSCAVVKDDQIIGYCDFYPVENGDFEVLKSGSSMIKSDMIALYTFGGQFDAYIAMIAVDPVCASQDTYMRIFDWIFDRIDKWRGAGIDIGRIGISVYQPLLEKFVKSFGFECVGINPAKGKIYMTDTQKLADNGLYCKRKGR